MNEKPQRFVAVYELKNVPQEMIPTRIETEYYIRFGKESFEREKIFNSSLREILKEYGVIFEEESHTVNDSYTREDFKTGMQHIQRNIERNRISEMEYISWNNKVTIRTDASKGPIVHKNARAILEAFLRQSGVEFELDCRMEFSSNVCQPLSQEMLDDAESVNPVLRANFDAEDSPPDSPSDSSSESET
jgi:hypothetical protein